jgi:plastocyanin
MLSHARLSVRFHGTALSVGTGALVLLTSAVLWNVPAMADTITIHMKVGGGPPRYEPNSKSVKVGDKVEWVSDSGEHTATPDSGQPDPFLASARLKPTEKHSVTITGSPRTIKYHCEVHGPGMAGELVIAP